MKKSNILIISLLTVILLFIVGSNLVLKAEFEKIDRKNPFYGYKQETVSPFKYVRIQGKQVGLTQIQPGAGYEIRYNADRKLMNWKVSGDTLEITYSRNWYDRPDRFNDFNAQPAVYAMAPQLAGVTAEGAASIVKGWKSPHMIIRQTGYALLLTGNTITQVSAQLSAGGVLKVDGKNKISDFGAQVGDSSTLHAEKNVFGSFRAQVDSTAHISLPGTLYRQAVVQ